MATYNEKAAIRSALRRAFARSPIVREVMGKVRREVPKFKKDGSRAKKDAVQYKCGVCSEWTKSTAIAVDHVDPVITPEGFVDWNTFVLRLFCAPENLQVICDTCHGQKTQVETTGRLVVQYTEFLDNIERAKVVELDAFRALRRLAKNKTVGLDAIVVRARKVLRIVERALAKT